MAELLERTALQRWEIADFGPLSALFTIATKLIYCGQTDAKRIVTNDASSGEKTSLRWAREC
jgi:hypothetical protein